MSAYMCEICKKKFLKLGSYNSHQYYHRNLGVVRFYCKYPNCCFEYAKYKSFKMHIYRNHLRSLKPNIYSCNVQNCCYQTGYPHVLNSHLYKHLVKEDILIKCPYSECLKSQHTFKTLSALKSHFYRYHFQRVKHLERGHSSKTLVSDYCGLHAIDNLNEDSSVDYEIDVNSPTLRDSFIKSLAATYLTLQAKHFLTDSALQALIDGLSDLNDINSQNLGKTMEEMHVSSETTDMILKQNLFRIAHDPEDGLLRSRYIRQQYYKKHFKCVLPVDICLEKKELKNTFFSYVPILETLKTLFSDDDVFNQWSKDDAITSDTFSDIVDGECYKKNEFFQKNPKALRLIIYQDSFEVCNPLGSSKKIHKIVGIYMTLGNIFPFNRCKVDQIQLVALCLESHVKKYGFDKIFDVIIKDVKILETSGIEIRPNMHVKGTIIAVTGDNLGSHQIGGFSENFSTANHFCRYCYATKKAVDKDQKAVFPLRTKDLYEHEVTLAQISGGISNGIKSSSVLNNCYYFHVCNPGLPPCLAHDVFEGILQYDFMLYVNKLVTKKVIDFSSVNDRLQTIRFHYEANSQKVPCLRKGDKLSGTACENFRLILIFPFVVYNMMTDDICWKMLFTLREICCILMSFKLSVGQLAYLKNLINEYLEMRTNEFPNVPLRPKHHYLKHYPALIRMFGPLRHLWTMRYESKHLYFKNILKRSPNFKNILHTLSEKHQLLQGLYATYGGLFSSRAVSNDITEFMAADYDETISKLILGCCNFQKIKLISTKVLFRGIIYETGMNVCCGKTDYGEFNLCTIKYVLINSEYSDVFFVGTKLIVDFNEFLNLYEITNAALKCSEFMCCHFSDLLTHEPLMHFVTPTNESLFAFKSAPYQHL